MCLCERQTAMLRACFLCNVEIGSFKAFPTFLSDSWMLPGTREQCCMRCFSMHTRYLHICVLSYHACPCLFQLFLSARCVSCFLRSNIIILYPPTLQVIPLPAWDSWFYWWRGFSNVTTCNVFVIRLFKALSTLVLVIQSCAVCDMLLLLLRQHHPDRFSHWWNINFHGCFVLF